MKVLFLVGALGFTGCTWHGMRGRFEPSDYCAPLTSKIKQVGACDKYGDCSATLEDGTQLVDVMQPIVGGRPLGRYCRILR